jgi:ParB family transcriptional regulator, chromosome partitioning protein
MSEALNVRQTELLVKRLQAVAAASAPTETLPVNPNGEMRAQLTYLEDRFRSRLGTRVNLNREANGSGRLVIHFYSDDDLNNIYRMIAGEDDDEASA